MDTLFRSAIIPLDEHLKDIKQRNIMNIEHKPNHHPHLQYLSKDEENPKHR